MTNSPSIREAFEARERSFMSPHGCLSSASRGRLKPERDSLIRTAFQRDRDRIMYSNAFRRLKHKTQVFLSPLDDQYRTRLTHTLEVAQIARTIARAMRLNEDLAEAISLGHDLGHPPFGHSGETALKEIFSADFSHNEQGVRIVDALEKNGRGLNLTYEVRDGILRHSKGYGPIIPEDPAELPCTVEGQIVRVADIMAYLNHDLDDAIRSGVILAEQVPAVCRRVLGGSHSDRATTMVRDLVFSSRIIDGRFTLQISQAVAEAMHELRMFLYENVYRSPRVHGEFIKAKKIISELYFFFLEHPQALRRELNAMGMAGCYDNGQPPERIVCDLIASMTDRHALNLYEKLFFPSPMV
ncbi:MAG TPA: deoxyguanosinetriphosphate triphosphohydrolase [Desulfobacteraceae bacterium]|nr:deoxyguanosinetriphosphate triphosphohydrolase [Deltaproteobacteria bacterium]RLB98953.1 MAG: deoxyguanosinetriphosphate triphosphohydrolase [Deltaproteobacteria bacterium]HDI59580.1 deoxyguanosinetriphosphate triphosphohydrolase [Desulfobacteraceae bacterium]